MDVSTALCATHPESPADGICSRCGTFLCERCRRWQAVPSP
ncbi:hypothetical protein F0U62_08415 [Cystobacter fuscus]|nr:hypothetical protein F0U62_08415 [Cystobacter fuscus]